MKDWTGRLIDRPGLIPRANTIDYGLSIKLEMVQCLTVPFSGVSACVSSKFFVFG